jgi:hypothetical protein
VEGDVIGLQNLEGRDIDKLKDRSGKLDHTLNFEKDIYEEESRRYPRRGEVVTFESKKRKCTGINILTQEIKLRGQSDDDPNEYRGEFRKITLSEYRPTVREPATPVNRSTHKQHRLQVKQQRLLATASTIAPSTIPLLRYNSTKLQN